MGNLQIQIINIGTAAATKQLELSSDLARAKKIIVKDNMLLSIDYKKYKDGIVWDDFKELDVDVKGKLKELAYYASVLISLKKIVDDFPYLDYDNQSKILQAAEEAYKIIHNTIEPKYLDSLILNKQRHLQNLDYTIKNQVEALMHRKPTSKKQKDILVLGSVSHIKADIDEFINVLVSFKVA